ncbi:hypothetical protein NC651_035776 [Populus alba x Populus x berolinensis]|nr:hypothetical protein NC651_035776 [Populus alba x Populus x berolinensis]
MGFPCCHRHSVLSPSTGGQAHLAFQPGRLLFCKIRL